MYNEYRYDIVKLERGWGWRDGSVGSFLLLQV